MKRSGLFISFVLFVIVHQLQSQSPHKFLRSGDKAYEDGRFDIAEEQYRKSLEKKEDIKGNFNLGNAVFEQERFEEALQHYETAINTAKSDFDKSKAYYNIGNSFLKSGQVEPGIEAYKKAIQLNPEDMDARKNLFLAQLMKQQQQKEQEKEQNDESQDQEKKDEDQNQNQQENQDSNQQENQQNSVNNENQADEESAEPVQLSREDALKLLEVIENEEKKVQEKLRKVSSKKKKPEKDW